MRQNRFVSVSLLFCLGFACKPRGDTSALQGDNEHLLVHGAYVGACGKAQTLLAQTDMRGASQAGDQVAAAQTTADGVNGEGLALADTPTSSLDLVRTKETLKTECARCHRPGSDEGSASFSDILDRDQLVAKKILKPETPEESKIFKRVNKGSMPPDRELPPEAKALILAWVKAGGPPLDAPSPAPSPADSAAVPAFISELDKLTCMSQDLAKVAGVDDSHVPFVRYFTLTHLHNAGRKAELAAAREALTKLVNSLSWHPEVTPPLAIDPAETIYRIDLRSYKWTAKTWELVQGKNPYAVTYSYEAAKAVYLRTQSSQPYVRGDWFVAAASRPPLYHDILGFPSGVGADKALEKMLGVDVAANLADGTAMRAGFRTSGVSTNNRLIERHPSNYGAYWKSYDFAGNDAAKSLFAHPTSFVQDGGEIIFNLPNKLQAYLLIDAKGNRLDLGPTAIVQHPKNRRGGYAVVNGLSCFECHKQGMIPAEDQVRGHVEANRASFSDQGEVEMALRLYRKKSVLDDALAKDGQRFQEAMAKAGGNTRNEEAVFQTAQRFEEPLDMTLAAAEVGLPAEEFKRQLAKAPELAKELGFEAAGVLDRQVFTRIFSKVLAGSALSVGFVASKSDPGNCPGKIIAGSCWFLGESGQSCDEACKKHSMQYDPRTGTYAGSGGSEDNCKKVAFEFTPDVRFISGRSDCVTRGGGVGCARQPPGQIEEATRYCVRLFSGSVDTTTAGAFDRIMERFCACQIPPGPESSQSVTQTPAQITAPSTYTPRLETCGPCICEAPDGGFVNCRFDIFINGGLADSGNRLAKSSTEAYELCSAVRKRRCGD